MKCGKDIEVLQWLHEWSIHGNAWDETPTEQPRLTPQLFAKMPEGFPLFLNWFVYLLSLQTIFDSQRTSRHLSRRSRVSKQAVNQMSLNVSQSQAKGIPHLTQYGYFNPQRNGGAFSQSNRATDEGDESSGNNLSVFTDPSENGSVRACGRTVGINTLLRSFF